MNHYIFSPNVENNTLDCYLPNFPLFDIVLSVSGSFDKTTKKVSLDALQILSRPTILKKGCADLLRDTECKCKIITSYLQEAGEHIDLLKDIVPNYCNYRLISDGKEDYVAGFSFGFQRKIGDLGDNVLMKASEFGKLLIGILQNQDMINGADMERREVFNYLQRTINPGDIFLFVLPDHIVDKSIVPHPKDVESEITMGSTYKMTKN